jgi:DHA3 family multidrug efflux protein-like MFS transporter
LRHRPVARFGEVPGLTALILFSVSGARTIGVWFGTGADRGVALIFVLTGIVGLFATTVALRSRPYQRLSRRCVAAPVTASEPTPAVGASPSAARLSRQGKPGLEL